MLISRWFLPLDRSSPLPCEPFKGIPASQELRQWWDRFLPSKGPVLKVGSECESWFTDMRGVWSVSLLLWSCFILGLGETASVSLLQRLEAGLPSLPSSSLSFSLYSFIFSLLSFSLPSLPCCFLPYLAAFFPPRLRSFLSFLHHPPFLHSFYYDI